MQKIVGNKICELANTYILDGEIIKNRGLNNVDILKEIRNYNDIVIQSDNNIVVYASNRKYEIYRKIATEIQKRNPNTKEWFFIFKKSKIKTKKNFERDLWNGNNNYFVKIKIRGRTTVRLNNGTKGSVYCSSNDTYNEDEGINRAFKKALSNQLLKEVNE